MHVFLYMYRQLRARRALSSIFKMFHWEPEGHYHCTMSIDGNRALLVLNRISLNSDSALLVLNRTSLNSDSALLSLKLQYIHLTQSQTFSTFSIHSSIQVFAKIWIHSFDDRFDKSQGNVTKISCHSVYNIQREIGQFAKRIPWPKMKSKYTRNSLYLVFKSIKPLKLCPEMA